ncbi:MAG: helix-turn-helix transcriptional regulator [Clostridia bacterium]
MLPISKFLKILRIENGENAKEMADKVGISPSYLSAIENGKRVIPLSFQSEIVEKYKLSDDQRSEFVKSIEDSSSFIKLDFSDCRNDPNVLKIKKIVFALTKKEISPQAVDEIYNLVMAQIKD